MAERVELDEQFVSLARETCDELRNWLFGQLREALSSDRALSAIRGTGGNTLCSPNSPYRPNRVEPAP
jgi:hypothetical protein